MNKKFKELNLKAVINKCNGQINFSIPKKEISKPKLKDMIETKSFKIFLEDF